MATIHHNLSEYNIDSVPDASGMVFGIVVSEWNEAITGNLLNGTINTLKKHGAKDEDIFVKTVPGSFELVYGTARIVNSRKVDAVIVLGCVIKGETPHFDYVCMGVTQGVAELNTSGHIPVIYGLLTTNNLRQAEERSGGNLGNKGDECAVTAIKMVNFAWTLSE